MQPLRNEGSQARTLREVLLSPRSVALIGQSNDPTKTAGRPLKYLRQAGYSGRIYPINARRDEVLGERAYPSLAALPEVPEHAYVVAPTDATVAAVEECGRIGVKVATVLADGFAEAGPEGLKREARLRETVARTGLRIVGPSSLGVVNLREHVLLTANAAFDEPDLPVGRIFVGSHSGSMIGSILSRGKARGIGFSGLVSVGGEVDLSLGDVCAATLDDPEVDGYLLFLETLRHADRLRAFALEASARGKPILAYKLGRSAQARELAVTHTGALAGEDDVASAFLAECGIARVDTLDALIEGLPLLTRIRPRAAGARVPRVAVVTTTAGGATTVVDPLGMRGVIVEAPSTATRARFAAAGIEISGARLIDLTIAGAKYETMKAALDILTTAPEFDLVLPVVGSSARFYPDLAVKPIIDSAGTAKPIAAFLVPDAPDALAQLSAAGVPSFRTPEACADAVAATLARKPPRRIEVRAHARPSGRGLLLDELAAYAVLDRIGVPRAPSLALDCDGGRPSSLPFDYPVAVKALSAEIAHKSDVGGVVLNVRDGNALLAAIADIRRTIAERRPGTALARVLVQPMAAGVGEVLIGYRIDPDVGPLVMLAMGGLYTEIYRDRSLRLAPVDLETADEMIAELRGARTLAGYRGKPKGDLGALARAIVALSRLALADEPVEEAEVNPLVVLPDGHGVVAVDALVKMAGRP